GFGVLGGYLLHGHGDHLGVEDLGPEGFEHGPLGLRHAHDQPVDAAALEGAAGVVRGALEVGVDRPPGARGTLEGDHRAAALTGEEAAQEVAALDARPAPPPPLAPAS